ncbi:MAG TPA: NADH-quinone oxidoreductase subunit C [Steroidobacteraceae bacterium]|nr:NADH-quinone oxidoreductase subunit C [Steroidobacteraceae bacterium]
MSLRREEMAVRVEARFGGRLARCESAVGELYYDVAAADLVGAATTLRDELGFEMLIDVAGVDYSEYGRDQWRTISATRSGFSRAVNHAGGPVEVAGPVPRFAAVYQLLSIAHNERLTLRAFCPDDAEPLLVTLTGVWAAANWFEREAFDLFGIVFDGHPDLRRLLTDYGFIGHPFRKDFPLVGHVEVRYDEQKKRVVYEPVQITERILVPRVIRDDARYEPELKGRG